MSEAMALAQTDRAAVQRLLDDARKGTTLEADRLALHNLEMQVQQLFKLDESVESLRVLEKALATRPGSELLEAQQIVDVAQQLKVDVNVAAAQVMHWREKSTNARVLALSNTVLTALRAIFQVLDDARWAVMESQASGDIAAGRVRSFKSVGGALEYLNRRKKPR